MPYSSSGCGLLDPECRRGCGVLASSTLVLGLPCSQSGASAARRPAVGVTSRSTDCRSSVRAHLTSLMCVIVFGACIVPRVCMIALSGVPLCFDAVWWHGGNALCSWHARHHHKRLTLGSGLARTRLSKFARIWRASSLLLSCSVPEPCGNAKPALSAEGLRPCPTMPAARSVSMYAGGGLHITLPRIRADCFSTPVLPPAALSCVISETEKYALSQSWYA